MFTFFFFNDTATTEIYTLSLHDALPICTTPETTSNGLSAPRLVDINGDGRPDVVYAGDLQGNLWKFIIDRKSTRLNSSHGYISYAVFCLKKKNMTDATTPPFLDTSLHIE